MSFWSRWKYKRALEAELRTTVPAVVFERENKRLKGIMMQLFPELGERLEFYMENYRTAFRQFTKDHAATLQIAQTILTKYQEGTIPKRKAEEGIQRAAAFEQADEEKLTEAAQDVHFYLEGLKNSLKYYDFAEELGVLFELTRQKELNFYRSRIGYIHGLVKQNK
jgi:hypothetical protein